MKYWRPNGPQGEGSSFINSVSKKKGKGKSVQVVMGSVSGLISFACFNNLMVSDLIP